jgi:hypothetical protein
MNKRVGEYIIKILFQDWKALEGIGSILVSCIAFLPSSELPTSKITVLIFGFGLIFILKIIKQFYKFYMNFHYPIKVLRKVQGDGGNLGYDIIVMENQENINVGLLVTLFCNSSGAEQPVCILEILSCDKGHDITAKQIIPSPDIYSINKYFEEESRRKSLYARTLISQNNINLFQKIIL